MANAHSHAFHRALRGRVNGGGGNFWSWREQMYAAAEQLNPDTYFALARAVFAEMVQAGFTVVGEFHYVHHRPGGQRYRDPNAMGLALRQAADEAGIRLTLLDTCYLEGGLNGGGHVELHPGQRRFSDGTVDAWAERMAARPAESDRVRLGAAIHSVRAVRREDLPKVVAAAGSLPLHVHLSEQHGENLACQMFYGHTPTELLDEAGALGSHLTSVHATHLTDRDIELLGGTGTGACICPTTERDLADGIGPSRALHDAGSPISLGSDQNVIIDPFVELRGIEMHERLITNERDRFSANDLLLAGSFNGYRALGWSDGGISPRAPSPTSSPCAPTRSTPRARRPTRSSTRAWRPTCRRSSSAATWSSATGGTASATWADCSASRSTGWPEPSPREPSPHGHRRADDERPR